MHVDRVPPFEWIRCDMISALLGYPSGHNPDPNGKYTESKYGVFMGSKNQFKVVTSDGETEYSVAQMLEKWIV